MRPKPPPAWIRHLLPGWRSVGGWKREYAPACNRRHSGNPYADRLLELPAKTYTVPALHHEAILTAREIAAHYPARSLWGNEDVWACLAYYQGAVDEPDMGAVESGLNAILAEPSTVIQLAAPLTPAVHLVRMDPRASMSDNLALVQRSLTKGTRMSPREIDAWRSYPGLVVGYRAALTARQPLGDGWFSAGGEPLHHPYLP